MRYSVVLVDVSSISFVKLNETISLRLQTSEGTYALDIKRKKTASSAAFSLYKQNIGSSTWSALWAVDYDWETLPTS